MDKRRFIITGYPRSRTAWMAAFLSSGDTICFHEPEVLEGGWFERVFVKGEGVRQGNVGISDSTVPARLSTFQLVCPAARVVVICRPFDDSLTSFCRFLKMDRAQALPIFRKIQTGLEELPRYFPAILSVDFSKLSDPSTLRSIWEFCCHTESFDEARAAIFNSIVCNQKLPT